MRVQAEHEAASAQLSLRLLQLLRQVKHLARGVVRVLTIQHKHTHTQAQANVMHDLPAKAGEAIAQKQQKILQDGNKICQAGRGE